MDKKSEAEERQKILDLIKDTDFAMFGTREGGSGRFHSRPMAFRAGDFDGNLWFFTKKGSRKVQDVSANPETLLCFSDPKKQNYVSVTGQTDVVTERAKVKELWTELYRTWFPHGPDDPEVVLLRVSIDHAEYWDAPSSAMVYAYGYLKAVATGKPPHPGEVGGASF